MSAAEIFRQRDKPNPTVLIGLSTSLKSSAPVPGKFGDMSRMAA